MWPEKPIQPLRGLEGVPGLPGAPQEEAGLTRKFETSHVGGATLILKGHFKGCTYLGHLKRRYNI